MIRVMDMVRVSIKARVRVTHKLILAFVTYVCACFRFRIHSHILVYKRHVVL